MSDFIQRCQDLSTACEAEFKAFPDWCLRKMFNDDPDKPPTNFQYDFYRYMQNLKLYYRVLFCSDLDGYVNEVPSAIERISEDHFVVSPTSECSNGFESLCDCSSFLDTARASLVKTVKKSKTFLMYTMFRIPTRRYPLVQQ